MFLYTWQDKRLSESFRKLPTFTKDSQSKRGSLPFYSSHMFQRGSMGDLSAEVGQLVISSIVVVQFEVNYL